MSVKVSPRPRRSRPRNPYEPFATVLNVLVTITVSGVILGICAVVFGNGSMFGIGSPDVCVRDDSSSFGADNVPPIFRPGVAVTPVALSLCSPDTGPGIRALFAATELPSFILYTVALLALWRLVRKAMRSGPFDRGNARRLRFIGWWISLGGIVAATCEGQAHNAIVRSMYRTAHGPGWLNGGPDAIPVHLILTGLGLLVVARILETGVRMHEDLEGMV